MLPLDPHNVPTIAIRNRWRLPLLQTVGGAALAIVACEALRQHRLAAWLAGVCLAGAAATAALGAVLLADRRPRVILHREGVDVAVCRTGLIRWQEIIAVETFRIRSDSGLALFLTAETYARLPPPANHDRIPVFANEAFAGPPIWFSDAALEATAEEIAAEITARRRGDLGPLSRQARR